MLLYILITNLPFLCWGQTLPLPLNPMAVTSSSFEILPDNIGFRMAINYASGVSIAMETFLNESLITSVGGILPTVAPTGQTNLPIANTPVPIGTRGTIEAVAKYINPIVLVGSTCIKLGSVCGKYNVNQNTMSAD